MADVPKCVYAEKKTTKMQIRQRNASNYVVYQLVVNDCRCVYCVS